MRQRIVFFLLLSVIASPLTRAYSQAPVKCKVQAPQPAGEADQAFAAGDPARAETLYRAKSGTPDLVSYTGIVRSQLEQNKLSEALATAQAAAAAIPSAAEAQALVGDVYTRSGQIPEASAAYAKGLALDQCSARAHFGIGRLDDLVARRASAQHELALAHGLAPGDAEISLAYLGVLPDPQRVVLLRSVLASHPTLPPATVEKLTNDLAALDQHKTCTIHEAATTANLDLTPLMFNGILERSWGLEVQVNSADAALMELDSSVSGIVLTVKDADRAGVHRLTTATPPVDAVYAAVADKVRIGSLEYRDCVVHVAPAKILYGANSLIGTDFFRDHLIHIDYVAKQIKLAPFPVRPGIASMALSDQYIAPEEKSWSPVYIAGSNVLIPTLINKKGPYLFLLDTGIANTILAPLVASNLLSAGTDNTINLQGIDGEIVKVIEREGGADVNRTSVYAPGGDLLRVSRPAKLPTYIFTSNRVVDDRAISFDLSAKSHIVGTEVSALLGFSILHNYSVDINYRDGLARILYDQNRRYESRERLAVRY
jgi:hypothetical protein